MSVTCTLCPHTRMRARARPPLSFVSLSVAVFFTVAGLTWLSICYCVSEKGSWVKILFIVIIIFLGTRRLLVVVWAGALVMNNGSMWYLVLNINLDYNNDNNVFYQ